MGEQYTLVADRFVYEDWQELQSVVGSEWVIGEPSPWWDPKPAVLGYFPAEGSYSGSIDKLELETKLYEFAVKRGAVELDWGGSFMIDWDVLKVIYAQQVRELLVEVMGFTPTHFDLDFIRNPDKEVVGL